MSTLSSAQAQEGAWSQVGFLKTQIPMSSLSRLDRSEWNASCRWKSLLMMHSDEGVLGIEVPYLGYTLQPDTVYDWNYTTAPQTGLNGRSIVYSRGRVLGGSSSISKCRTCTSFLGLLTGCFTQISWFGHEAPETTSIGMPRSVETTAGPGTPSNPTSERSGPNRNWS